MESINKHKHQGFTLIELMITVVIVGILAAIAYPSYQEHLRKYKRAEGRVAILQLMQQQERYMTQNNKYLAFNANSTSVPFKTFSGNTSNTSAFHLGARACADQTIENCVEVFGIPKYTDPFLTELTLRSTGLKGCTSTKPSVCWN